MKSLCKGVCVAIVAVTLANPAPSQRFHDTPENRWVYETLLNFSNAGLSDDFPRGIFRGPSDRIQIAAYIDYIYKLLQENFESINSEFLKVSNKPINYGEWLKQIRPVRERIRWFGGLSKDVSALVKMTEVFASELTQLGKNPEEIKTGIWVVMTRNAELRGRIGFSGEQREIQFPSVPAGHWVYDALEEGRNRGHFFGYPDGWFRGQQTMTRYELAGAVNAFYQDVRREIMNIYDEVSSWQNFPGGPLPGHAGDVKRWVTTNWVSANRLAIGAYALRLCPGR